jgi:hypothetical protein
MLQLIKKLYAGSEDAAKVRRLKQYCIRQSLWQQYFPVLYCIRQGLWQQYFPVLYCIRQSVWQQYFPVLYCIRQRLVTTVLPSLVLHTAEAVRAVLAAPVVPMGKFVVILAFIANEGVWETGSGQQVKRCFPRILPREKFWTRLIKPCEHNATWFSDYRRSLDWWPDLFDSLIQRMTTLNTTHCYTHMLMSTVTSSLLLLDSGYKRRKFPFH